MDAATSATTALTSSRARTASSAAASTLEELAPGQYWRPRKRLKQKGTTRAQHPAIPKDFVLLVTELEYADGHVHSVHLAAHPTWCSSQTSHVHVNDFLCQWERAWDADQVREAELRALGLAMQATQAEMLAGPPSTDAAALLQHEPAANAGGTGKELATPDGLQALVDRAGALQRHAEAQATWIEKHAQTLGAQGETLARFHEERGQAMLARANNQLRGASKVFEMVKNLRLYTGEEIGLDLIRDGTPAPPDAPLTIYQDLLSLDEETGALLDEGGMDHRHAAELAQLLDDPALQDRLIPAPRGIVLCRFRRRDKEFVKPRDGAPLSEALGAMLANHALNAASHHVHLMVRDGGQFWLVSHETLFHGMKQLMPNTSEQNEQFIRKPRWWDDQDGGARITPEDLDYAEAQRDQLGTLGDYARALIVLWGLRDRTDLFGTSAIPRHENWLDPGFQSRHLRLVSQDAMIGEERESYAAFRDRHNAYLVSGSYAAVEVNALFGELSAPGCFGPECYDGFRRRHGRNRIYRYTGPGAVVDRVRYAQGRPYIEIPVIYDGYSGKVTRGTKTAKLWLTDLRHVLVVDRVHGADLDYFLGSRTQRRDYADYLALFRAARTHVRQRDLAEHGLRLALAQAVVDARIPHDVDALPRQITDAIATVRVAARGESGDTTEIRKKALNTLHAVVASGRDRVDAAEALAQRHGRTPLRLVHTGKGTWRLYAAALATDRDPRLASHPWVAVTEMAFDAQGASQRGSWTREVLRAVAGEQVIHDWPGLALCAQPPKQSWDQAQRALARVHAFSEDLFDKLAIAERAYQIADKAMEASRRLVERVDAAFAIGTVLQHGVHVARGARELEVLKTRTRVLLLGADALALAYHWGDDRLRDQCRAAVRRYYANKTANLERLERVPLNLRLGLISVERFGAVGTTSVFRVDNLASLPDAFCWGSPTNTSAAALAKNHISTCLQLTTLSAAGAKHRPDLIGHCESPSFGVRD